MAKSLDDLQKQVQRELGLSGSDLSDSLIRSQVDNIVNLRAKRLGLLDPKPATPADDLEEPNGTVGDWLLEASKGFMSATQLFPNTAQFLGNLASDSFDETAVGRGVRGASDFLERGSEAAADLQSEGFREKTSAPIYDDATGEWHMPNATQVVSTVLTALPQIPAYMVGAGGVNALASGARLAPRAYKLAKLAGVGSAAARGIAKFAPNAVSYGAAGGVLGGGDTFNESRGDVLATLEKMNSDLPADERERLASKLATEAAVRQLPIAALMNAVGLGGAASATGSIWKRIATGAAEEIPAEAIEEASQGVNVNLSTQKVDPTRDMWAGVRTRAALGAIAGGVMGGGVAGLESVAEKQRSAARETLRRELDVNPQDIISGAHRPGGLPPDTGAPAAGLMAPVTNTPPAAEQQRTLTGEVLERPAALGANLPQLPGRTIDAPPPALRGPELTGPSSGPQPNGARQALPSIAPPKQGRTPEQRQAWREASVAAALAADSSERLDNEIPGWKEMDDGGKAAIINAVVDADGNAQTEQGKLVQQWAEHQAAGIAAVQKAAAADGGTENIDFRAERQRALAARTAKADGQVPAKSAAAAPDAAVDHTEETVAAHRLKVAKDEITRDIAAGKIPADVTSFAQLHDHVDANEYINDSGRQDRMIGPLGKKRGWKADGENSYTGFTNQLVGSLDAWLAGGRKGEPVNPFAGGADKGDLSKQDALKQSLKARQNEPTEAQKAAGNYAKEHVRMHGLDIAIENPRGSTRSGTDENGKSWSNEIAHDYGYIKRTEGNDGDHVDVFIGPNLTSDKVFVVNQTNKDGSFDEHKVMLGFSSEKAATDGYLANYDAGWDRFTGVVPMSIEQFKTWLKDGDQQAAGRLGGGLPDAGRERPENQRAEAEGAAGRDAEVTSILDAADVRGKERLEAVAKVRSGEYTIDDLRGAYPSKKAAAKEPAATNPAEPIGDFGEKIGGARKDVWSSFKDKMQAAEGLDIAAEPLSKTWPVPDYQALLDGGADPWSVAFMHAVRDEIPAKPKKGWKLKSWVSQVEMLRDLGTKAIDGRVNAETVRTKLAEAAKTSRGLTDVAGRAELYQLVGHEKSLAGVRISSGEYSLFNGVEYKPPKIIWSVEKDAKATAFSNWPRQLANGDTRAEAIANFKAKYSELEISPPAAKGTTFEIYSKRGEEGYWVGKKVGRNPILLKGGFASAKEARAYKDANNDELVKLLEKHKEIPRERRDVNNPRVGEDMRQGKDVTPAMFAEAFGFRGVEFGNWVDQKKRQKDLNDAYDALMDMAAVIGVHPRALSLNGELGLAFGARGKGGVNAAAAHFEPGFFAINLTKNEGAGSLGHEWWHALDSYFSRMRGKPADMMTDSLDVSLAARGSKFVHQGAVRKEMIEAYGAVLKAINDTNLRKRSGVLDGRRSKEYWTTSVELSARTYESYLIAKLQDQGAANDYLANIVDEETWRAAEKLGFELENSYPYPLADESPAIRAAFDKFFQTIESREEGDKVVLFKRAGKTNTEEFSRWFGDSKVVDADGNPKVVYRGEHSDTDGQLNTRHGALSFSGSETANVYAESPNDVGDSGERPRVIPAYVSIQRPVMNEPSDPFIEFKDIIAAVGMDKAVEIAKKFADQIENTSPWQEGTSGFSSVEEMLSTNPDALANQYMLAFPLFDDSESVEMFKGAGFDGAIHGPYGDGDEAEYRPFSASQVKSVFNRGTFDKENPDILMRRSEESGEIDVTRQGKALFGMSADEVRSTAAGLMKGWRNRPPVIVVQSEEELAKHGVAGEIILNMIVDDGAEGEIRGVFFAGKVYLIAGNIPSADDVAITVAHEAVGHYGLRELLGDDKHAALMDSIYLAYGKSALIRALPDYKLGKANWNDIRVRRRAADELVAHIAELRKKPGVVKMIVARIREWIRTYFPGVADKINLRLNDDDIIALVARAAENLKKPPASVVERQRGLGPEAAYSQRNGNKSPWYYSAVESAVEDVRQEKATPDQWKAMIAKTPGVKREEIEWTGLNEWLDQKSGAVSKAEVLEFVKAGGVQIEEVLKTTDAEDELPGDWDVRESAEEPGMWEVVDSDGEVVAEGNTRADAIENARDNDYSGQAPDDTKYGSYQLKGGSNYKELLLTLPSRPTPMGWALRNPETGGLVGNFDTKEKAESYRSSGPRDDVRGFEVYQTVTGKENDYRSSHWSEKNVLAHIRFNERTDADGNRVLHIEEIQSDWHQAGRKSGYGVGKKKAVVENAEDGIGFVVRGDGGTAVMQTQSRERADQYAAELNASGGAKQGVPDAPFKGSSAWSMLAMKRMIRYAVDNGFDAVTWTGGKEQAARYDMSKHLSRVKLVTKGDGLDSAIFNGYPIDDGKGVMNRIINSEEELADLIGKDLAAKLIASKKKKGTGGNSGTTVRELDGVDLKVGGEGMIGFYDKILPSETSKLLKKFGGKIEQIGVSTGQHTTKPWVLTIEGGERFEFDTKADAEHSAEGFNTGEITYEPGGMIPAQGFRITDQLRDAATTGLPLFQQKEDADSPYRDAVVGLTVLAREDDLFKVPRSSSKELAGIFADIDPKIRVEVSEAEAKRGRQETGKPIDKAWFVYMPRQAQGRTTFDEVAVYQAGREVWINASHLKEGASGGSRLYAAVGNYAFNNGRVFIGDPMGLSDIALLRRTEHMLSLALKFGTTRFLAPHQKQIAPASDSQSSLRGKVQGMDWRPGDDGYNLTQLVKRSYLNTVKFLPEVGHVQFDTSTLRFVDGDGNPLADGDWDAFQRLYLRRLDDALHAERAEADRGGVSAVQGGRGSAAGGGEGRSATLKRAALVSALLRGESRVVRREVLVALGGGLSRRALSDPQGKRLKNTDVFEVFYKRVRDADPASGAQFTIPEESMVDTFVRKVQDKFFPVKKAQRAIEESAGAQLPDHLNVYQHEEASHGRIETAMREFESAHVKPLVAAMSEAKVDRETLDSFLYAMHAGERNAHIAEINPSMPDGGSGMTNDQAEEILAEFRKSGDFDKLAALAKRVYAMNAARLKVIRDSGLESAETIAEWSQYKYYVPLKGNAENSGWSRGVAQGFSVKGKESKQALGRRSVAESPLLHSIAQAEQTLMRAEKNRVAQSFLRLVQAHPNPDLWEVVTAKSDNVRRYNKQTREVEIAPNIQLRNDPDVFVLKVDGQETYIRVHDERLLTAMKNMGPEPLNALTKALGWVNRKLAAVNTSLNPEFVISNFVRDLQTAAANLETEVGRKDGRLPQRITKQVLADIPKAVRGIYQALRETDGKQDDEWVRHFNEFRADGGQIGFFGLTDYETKAAELQAMLEEANGDWKALGKKGVRALWEFISDANSSIENATRLSAYVNARRAGVSRAKAASLAKNLTVNFNRKGELGALINSLYLFSNASIQGTAQLVRVVGSKKGAYLATAIAGGALLLAELNRAMAGDDDDERNFYDKVPDHVRERNLIVMKWWRDDGAYMTFPLPYGYNVFVVAGNTVSDLAHGKKVSEAAVGMAGTMVGAFSPLGSEGSSNSSTFLAKLASPTVLDPAVQLAVNENFAGQPIFNEGFPLSAPRPDSSLYWKSTSEVAKWLASTLNATTGGSQYRSGWADVSPDSVEHLFGFVTGGAGGFILRVGNAAERLATGDEMPTNIVPFYRKLNAEPNDRQDVGLYYDRRDALRQIKDEWEAVRKEGPEAQAEYREEHGQELKMLPAMKVAEKKLKALRDQRKRIEQGKVPEEMKRPRLKAIDDQIKKAVDDFNRQYGRTVGN